MGGAGAVLRAGAGAGFILRRGAGSVLFALTIVLLTGRFGLPLRTGARCMALARAVRRFRRVRSLPLVAATHEVVCALAIVVLARTFGLPLTRCARCVRLANAVLRGTSRLYLKIG